MKKMKKFLVFLLVVTMIALPFITVNAEQCIHEQRYWNSDLITTYQFYSELACYETKYYEIECKICGATWESGRIYTYINHNWVHEDLGHVPNEAKHDYRHTCTQCLYSYDTRESCDLIH
jgi:hypothetical protein